ncbi:MAG: hypothetical protein ACPGXZ_06680 [Saprospiraceae bacterium]
MKKIFPILLFATSIFFFQSCLEGEEVEELIVQGMQPVYYSGDNINAISALPPQPITRLGKIYHKAPYIFMNDLQKGIHVVDNTDPANPVKVAFWDIPGNKDISIKGDFLYVDNYEDLVCIDISDMQNIQEVSRVENLYTQGEGNYPENYNGHFECVDATKGTVIGWFLTELKNPKCSR